jgi:hypothetical protein
MNKQLISIYTGIAVLLTFIMILMKAMQITDYDWLWVLLPIWIIPAFGLGLFISMIVIAWVKTFWFILKSRTDGTDKH